LNADPQEQPSAVTWTDEMSRNWTLTSALLDLEYDARTLSASLKGLVDKHRETDAARDLLALFSLAHRAEARLTECAIALSEEFLRLRDDSKAQQLH